MSAADLQAILGVDEGTATALLEAAGGNMELAINLGMDGGGGGGEGAGGVNPSAGGGGGGGAPAYPHWSLIWPEAGPVPDSWSKQRLDAFDATGGLIQNSNGPCGVLAVLQLELWQREAELLFATPADKAAKAVESILNRIMVATNSSENKKAVAPDGTEGTAQEVSKKVCTAQELVEAAVLTKSVDKLKAEMAASGAAAGGGLVQPLVDGPFWLCGADLMSLLLRGTAGGNYSAYDATGDNAGKKRPFYDKALLQKTRTGGFGILSWSELEEGIPLADDLKFPELGCYSKQPSDSSAESNNSSDATAAVADPAALQIQQLLGGGAGAVPQEPRPMWIIHGGDHFTAARQLPPPKTSAGSGSDGNDITIEHYNGLPPGGPRHATITIKSGRTAEKVLAPDQHVEGFKKKKPGQADDIVQAKKTSSKDYKDWSFEVVPAVDDPDVQGAVDEDPLEPLLMPLPPRPVGKPWRCAWCYATRFKTMQFGINEPLPDGSLADDCNWCGKLASSVGWGIWLPFDELPPSMKRRANRMYAPKYQQIFGTVWKGCEVSAEGETAPAV